MKKFSHDEWVQKFSNTIFTVKESADLQSLLDSLTDLQESIDNFTYQFKLD